MMKASKVTRTTLGSVLFALASAGLAASLVSQSAAAKTAAAKQPRMSELPPPTAPDTNPITPEKTALGKQLFFDKRMSGSGTNSCESCHYRHLGWTDGLALSKKDDGSTNTRHTPTLYNVGYLQSWYWDGRSTTLEAQTLAAWRGQTGADPAKIATILNAVPGYQSAFQSVFGGPATPENIVAALATYIRMKNSGDSPWDRFEKGDAKAVSADAKAGYKLFSGKGRCIACHTPPVYTNSQFFNIGLEAKKEKKDPGRFNVTKLPADMSAFKVPTLRSVALSGPYFHDGSVATLEEAVRYMANTHAADPNKSPILVDAKLTNAEIKKIVAFLESLTSNEPLERPTLP
jgi:cytochrome c peroxidase